MSQLEHTVDPSEVRAIVGRFEEVRREHPHFKLAYQRAKELTSVGRASRVVIIAGPTGVGKSTLGRSIRLGAWKQSREDCAVDPSLVPAVLVTATAPHGPSFNWKDFYVRTLEQLNEPLIEKKVYPGQQLTMFDTVPGMMRAGESLSTDPLRRQIERAFQRRKTRLWIIDEAHHILMCHNPRHLENQFEALKSLADMCNATLVLLGTYKLLEIRDHSAQLMRRSQIVHFPSYRLENAEDKKAFKSALAAFAKELPLPLEQSIAQKTEYFFNKTAGCIGILRDLLRDALEDAAQNAQSVIDEKALDRSSQSNKAILRILEESALGCLALEDLEASTVRSLVRLPPHQFVEQLNKLRSPPSSEGEESPGRAKKPTSARGGKPVGHRHPARDKVGGAGRVGLPTGVP